MKGLWGGAARASPTWGPWARGCQTEEQSWWQPVLVLGGSAEPMGTGRWPEAEDYFGLEQGAPGGKEGLTLTSAVPGQRGDHFHASSRDRGTS